MRKGQVFYKDKLAGIIAETQEGYHFSYDAIFMAETGKAISFSFPIAQKSYDSQILFPFFDGLIPEGWLLNIALDNWKINPKDRFGLLLTLCGDCIGCVSVKALEDE